MKVLTCYWTEVTARTDSARAEGNSVVDETGEC